MPTYAILRSVGLRATPQRMLVYDALDALGHATPNEILAAIKEWEGGVHLSTVFRALQSLEAAGIVRRSVLAAGTVVYYLVDEDTHVHLVCRECGELDCIGPRIASDLATRLLEDRRFALDVGHLALSGTCHACRTAALTATA